jgi:hypothetical protein
MGWSLVASTSKGSADGITVTTDAIDTTGATFLAVVAGNFKYGGVGATLSDNKGITWTAFADTVGDIGQCRLYYAQAPVNVGSGHTFTLAGTDSIPTVAVMAFGGYASWSTDQTNDNNSSTSEVNDVTTGSITPTGMNRLIVAGLAAYANIAAQSIGTVSVDSSMTLLDTEDILDGGHVALADAYYFQPDMGGAINADFSWDGDPFVAQAVIGSFNGVTPPPPGQRPLVVIVG